jgi:NAD(P)H-hydrate repair Nnr-like enzyme with NAD(P)H-hydrate dehydratase domain
VAQANAFSKQHPSILVLKGKGTLVLAQNEITMINTSGNDGLATAGSGDVLTGMIASLCAQGYSPFHAACIGVFLHGLAADLAIKHQSKASLVASDIITYLGQIRLID